jgi:glycosyltransferase involved in cell wall biosynthesis
MDTTVGRILSKRPVFVTMLRHPVDRIVSLYNYLRRVYHPEHELVRKMSLEDFLDYEQGNFVARNYSARMIAGYTYGASMGQCDDPEILELAKQKLAHEFGFFGIAERYSESLRLLEHTFGWEPAPIVDRRNVAPKTPGELSQEVLGKIESANRLSLELYRWAGELFNERYKELVRSYGEADASFEAQHASRKFAVSLSGARDSIEANIGRLESDRPVELPRLFLTKREALPLVSVITPTYNHQNVIGQCIRSVIEQTYGNWEMIVIDDGSTDHTGATVCKFGDPRIRYVPQQNRGIWRLKETYNAALRMAKGSLIAILEGDDFWPADKLEAQVPDFEDGAVVLSSGFTAIFQDGGVHGQTPVQTPSSRVGLNRPVGIAALQMMQPDNLTHTFPVSTMIRAGALRDVGGFQQPKYLPLVDFPTFLRLSVEGEFRFHERVLGYWRRHGESVTKGNLSSILENAYRYSFEFLSAHRDRIPVSDADLDALERSWDEVSSMRCMLRGRLLARQGEKKLAGKAFREAMLYRHSTKTAIIAQMAAALATLGIPVEPIYRALGKPDLEAATTLDTGDKTVTAEDMGRPRVVGRWRNSK